VGVGVIVGVEVMVGVGVTLGVGVNVGVRVLVGARVGEGEGTGEDVLVDDMDCAAEKDRGSEIDKLLQLDNTRKRIAYSRAVILGKPIDLIFTTPPNLRGESFRLYINKKNSAWDIGTRLNLLTRSQTGPSGLNSLAL
jgi:hypothetical protein